MMALMATGEWTPQWTEALALMVITVKMAQTERLVSQEVMDLWGLPETQGPMDLKDQREILEPKDPQVNWELALMDSTASRAQMDSLENWAKWELLVRGVNVAQWDFQDQPELGDLQEFTRERSCVQTPVPQVYTDTLDSLE